VPSSVCLKPRKTREKIGDRAERTVKRRLTILIAFSVRTPVQAADNVTPEQQNADSFGWPRRLVLPGAQHHTRGAAHFYRCQ
jgi:hypothetical protein